MVNDKLNGSWLSSDPPPDEAHQRVFAINTGLVFQFVGSVFFLGACCLWSLSGMIVKPAAETSESWMAYLSGAQWLAGLLTLDAAITVVGGLALVAAGIGLYGERPESAKLAMAVAGGLAIAYWTFSAVMLVKGGVWGPALIAAVLGAVCLMLFLLGAHSAAVLRKFPPPPNRAEVTEEFLRQYRREREERRKKFDA